MYVKISEIGRQQRGPTGYPHHITYPTALKLRVTYFEDQLNTCHKLATNPKLEIITNTVVLSESSIYFA